MMKNNKKLRTALIVFIVILALVLCFNVGVYAAYALAATEVSYTKPGTSTSISVKTALDELYTNIPKYKVGDAVTYKGEPFFVIADKGTTYELLAKYVLNSAATKQENADTNCGFSTSNYWSGETLSSSPYLNLNTYLAVRNDTGSAVYKANNYAKSLGAIGGRLLTYEEANSLKDSYEDIIFVTYGKSRYYWLGSAGVSNKYNVWHVGGGRMYGVYFDGRYSSFDDNRAGVRPVIEILKSAI